MSIHIFIFSPLLKPRIYESVSPDSLLCESAATEVAVAAATAVAASTIIARGAAAAAAAAAAGRQARTEGAKTIKQWEA